MTRIRGTAGALALAAAAGLPARAAAAPVEVAARIAAVTVYADRAQVTRTAAVELPAGTTVFAFAHLPGWIDEDSVRAALPAGAGRIVDVEIRREYLAGAAGEDLRKAEAALREIEDQVGALDDEAKALDAQDKQVADVRVFSMEKLPKDAAAGQLDVKAYAGVVQFVGESLRTTAAARREIGRKRRDLEPERAARQKRVAEVRQRSQVEERTVLVSVEAPQAGRAELALSCLLPGAAWQPAHELRAEGAHPDRVTLASYAVVTQTTGEDWRDAALSFSTQSPEETIRIPELEALRLGLPRGLPPRAAARKGSFDRARAAFEGQNTAWFSANNPGSDLQLYLDNGGKLALAQQAAAQVFRQVQQRGTTAHFAGVGRPAVRTDGQPVRVPIGAMELPAAHRIVAAPETSLNAARTVALTNTGARPLLPGAVALYREGAFLGLTDLDFVAEGESFALHFGVADQLKLSRVLDRRQSSLARGQRTRMQVAFDVGVENLSKEPVALKLMDRVPVSEDREIRVFGVSVEPDGRPDAQGLIAWDLELKPGEKRVYRVAYGVEYPAEALHRARDMQQDSVPNAAAPIVDQIRNLEAKF